MRNRWDNLPIVYKLFIALFGVIALIVVVLLSYVWGYESNLMLKKEQDFLQNQSISVATDLNAHLSRLQKEVLFLSRLEVMNDMVTHDMDKRIAKILEQKADDLGESIVLFTVAPDGTIPSASKLDYLKTRYKDTDAIRKAVKEHKKYLFLEKNLYLFAPIYGSFYTHDFLGYIVISYPLKNFVVRLKADQKMYRWLTPPRSLAIGYEANNPTLLNFNDYLYHSLVLDGVLEGWILHYAMPKKEALSLLYHFQILFLSVLGIGLVLIAFLIWIIVRQIIKPLRELSETAMRIAMTGDYTQTVPERGNDEIGTMGYSFNALMYTTQVSMKRLEIEREKHFEKLISLIVFFNAITRTDTKEATIEIAMEEIRRFSNAKEIYFTLDKCDEQAVSIALNAVGNETKGIICIKEPVLEKESNERFYAALERMLALQMERIELLGKTQAALEAKSAFLSAMSHELRTPLGSILSLTQYAIIQPQTPEPILETFEKIENSAYHLLGVINNILDLAKAESGKMEPHIAACNPKALIEDALELVFPLAEEKGLEIKTIFEPFDPVFASDARLFRQVVINLLSNAIKYTHEGFIDIVLHYNEGVFTLDVKDSGRGIGSEALEHLFDEFYQVYAVDTSGLKGSGLGLALSRQIALVLQGDLSIISEGEGKGTTATFWFRSF